MIIANPLYDTIFKYLMEDLGIAKGFLSKIIGREIHELTFYNREHSRYIPENDHVKERIKLFRLDFIADIETEQGMQKVLIELQKSNEYDVAHRFRAYIGKIYSQEKEDYERAIKEESRQAKLEKRAQKLILPPQILPVIPIVILGFKLEPDAPSTEDRLIYHIKRVAVNPNAGNAPLAVRYQLAECLSHDLILIQIPYLPEKPRTDLELLLSIFEQRFFLEDEWKKDYPHCIQEEHSLQLLLQDILQKLHLVTADVNVIEKLKAEEEGELFLSNHLAFLALMKDKEQALQEKSREIQEKEQALQEKDQALKYALQDKEQALQRALHSLISQGMSEAQAKSLLGL